MRTNVNYDNPTFYKTINYFILVPYKARLAGISSFQIHTTSTLYWFNMCFYSSTQNTVTSPLVAILTNVLINCEMIDTSTINLCPVLLKIPFIRLLVAICRPAHANYTAIVLG